jgi:type 1 glutamine amidotransferase
MAKSWQRICFVVFSLILLFQISYQLLFSHPVKLNKTTSNTVDIPLFSVLVFSKTAGYRHASIADGITAFQELGQQQQFQVDATEDAAVFNDADLATYQVIIFLCTSGDILNVDQQGAMERFIQNGGGFVGIHSASDTEYGWPWYGQLVGAYFSDHPAIQEATTHVIDQEHTSTLGLPEIWVRTDEWYNFATNPTGTVNVLINLDESTYSGGSMGDPHPISWYHEFDNGRSWYTGMGHTSSTYDEPLFRQHLLGGILWAAGIELEPVSYLPIIQK